MSQSNPIPRSNRRTDYTLSANQVLVGPTGWKVFDILDVAVLVKEPTQTAFTKLTSGFTVTATGAYPSTISVTLSAARPVNTILRVQGARTPERSIDATRGGTISSSRLEDELDRQVVVGQEFRRDIDDFSSKFDSLETNVNAAASSATAAASSATAASGSATAASGSAAAAASSASSASTSATNAASSAASLLNVAVLKDGSVAMTGALTLSANATNNLHAVPKQQLDAAIAANTAGQYATRAAVIAATIGESITRIDVLGYSAAHDAGGGQYKRLSSTPSPVKAWHVASNSGAVYWELITDKVTPRQMGAVGNGSTDDTAACQAWLDYGAASGAECHSGIAISGYLITSSLNVPSNVKVRVAQGWAHFLVTTDTPFPVFSCASKDSVDIDYLHGKNTSGMTSTTSNAITLTAGTTLTFTVQSGKSYSISDAVMIISTASPANYMICTVSSYSGTTLQVTTTTAGSGSGTFADWKIHRNDGNNILVAFDGGSHCALRNSFVEGAFYVGARQQNGTNHVIDRCRSSGVINRPFYAYSTSGTLNDCAITNCYVAGGSFTQYGINVNGSTGGTISRLLLHGNKILSTIFQGIEIGGNCGSITSTSNHVSVVVSSAGVGFLVQRANSLRPSDVIISGNQVASAGGANYDIIDSSNFTITGNTSVGAPVGMRIRQLTASQTCGDGSVTGNIIRAFTSKGLTFQCPQVGGWVQYCAVTGNRIVGTGGSSVGLETEANCFAIHCTGNSSRNCGTDFSFSAASSTNSNNNP